MWFVAKGDVVSRLKGPKVLAHAAGGHHIAAGAVDDLLLSCRGGWTSGSSRNRPRLELLAIHAICRQPLHGVDDHVAVRGMIAEFDVTRIPLDKT